MVACSCGGTGLGESLKGFKELFKVKQIWVLVGLCIISMGCYDTLLNWLPSLLEIRGLSVLEAGVTASLYPLGFLFAGPILGYLSDRMGLRRPFIWILGSISPLLVLFLIYSSGSILRGTILLTGFSLSGLLTLILIILTEQPEASGFVGGVIGLVSSMGNIGSILFPLFTGFLIDLTRSPLPPLALLTTITAATLILNLALKETGRSVSQKAPDYAS
jgi:CP family cyanate transporter-like MFS transporter